MGTERAASRTAVLVCQGRAAADGLVAPGRFTDPVAMQLLRDDERAVVEQVRTGEVPEGWAARLAYESVAACAVIVPARTVLIDEAIRAHPHPQLVIVGAGLDTRAWRMAQLEDVDVTEVDHPASQADKRDRVGELPPLSRTHRFQPADLAADDLGATLELSGHDAETPTTWLWEGVVPYLSRDAIRRTLRSIAGRSARGSTLIVNYQTPSLRARIGRRLVAVASRLGRHEPVTADEPWRTLLTPQQTARLLADAGFGVATDDDLLAVAVHLGLDAQRVTSLRNGRVAVAVRH